MKTHFIVYGSGKFENARDILAGQARSLFDHVHVFSQNDISNEFLEANKHIFKHAKGGGYWIWKPYFVLKVLKLSSPGDILMYADAGCRFVSGDLSRYVDLVEKHGFVGFQLPHLERMFSKGDIFSFFQESIDTDRCQVCATTFLLKNEPIQKRFVSDWLSISQNEQLVTDAPSISPNHWQFRDNRHDQSIFSFLVHKYKFFTLEDETWPRESAQVIFAARLLK